MSDGPHRSLPMRRCWRRLAERADKCAFSPAEVAEALLPALEAECRSALTPQFLGELQRAVREPRLFGPIQPPHEDLQGQTPSGFAGRVIDNVAVLSDADISNADSLLDAFQSAIKAEAPRYFRQIEEHYLRNGSTRRAERERDRLYEALARADVRSVAEKLLRPYSTDATRAAKKSGLDDGVSLR